MQQPTYSSNRPSHFLPYTTRQSGFSFIEIMVVLVIVGLMAITVGSNFLGRADEARTTKVYVDFEAIASQLKLYRLDNSRYPTTEQGLQALVEKTSLDPLPKYWPKDGYLESLPEDPWGNPYLYSTPGQQGAFEIYSYGADGVAGGADQDADLYSWDKDKQKGN